MPSTNIVYVSGHPRSGNTWLNRLLSDLLDSPLSNPSLGWKDYTFCKTGKGGSAVVKTHWWRDQWKGDGTMVFIQRDPRDVAISMMFYRNLAPTEENLTTTIDSMRTAYIDYISPWLNEPAILSTKYELLHTQSQVELQKMSMGILGVVQSKERISEVVARQSFNRWAHRYSHVMRKGIVGDWKNYLTREHGEQINDILGEEMLKEGYITDPLWWEDLPQRR